MDTSAEQVNQDGDSIVTLGEVLQAEEEMIEDANAVLGAGDDKNCTYTEGYMKRQALYACLTCNPDAKTDPSKRAGICLACCYHCHDGHELVELYTKRNFRCDCGNRKFPNMICNLNKCKDPENILNNYNQNFSGVYCTCGRPYPDPDDNITDEMIQCIICEDWFHTRHLGCTLPPMNSYAEMTCKGCIQKHEFLLHYDNLCIKSAKTAEDIHVEIEDVENEKKPEQPEKPEQVQEKCVLENTNDVENVSNDVNNLSEEKKTENPSENAEKLENGDTEKTEENSEVKDIVCDGQKEVSDKPETQVEEEAPSNAEVEKPEATDAKIDNKESNESVEVEDKTEAGVENKKEETSEVVSMEVENRKEPLEKEKEGGDAVIQEPLTNGELDVCSKPKAKSTEISANLEVCTKPTAKSTEVSTKLEVCTKPTAKSTEISAKFWSSTSWRQKLCTCSSCLKMYEEEKVLFLIDGGDTVQHYEEKGKAKSLENAKKAEEDSIKFLNSVDRVPLMETLAAFNDLKENLIDYLKKFAENKKVVREEDIREFFSDYESRKKQKVDIPHMCR